MATIEVELIKGLTTVKDTVETVHKLAEIREVTAGDLIDATEESEKLIQTPEGYQLIASPTLVGLNTLRRQIVRIGEHPGPLTMGELRKLNGPDLSLLQEKAQQLDSASLTEATKLGKK